MRKLIYPLLLCLAVCFASCHDDNNGETETPVELVGERFYDNHLKLNGTEQEDGAYYYFDAVSREPSRLMMTIEDAFPVQTPVQLEVDVKNEGSTATLTGTKTTDLYELNLNGTCRNNGKDGYLFDVQLNYTVKDVVKTEHPYVIRFDNGDVMFPYGTLEPMEFDGQQYAAMDFMTNTMKKIMKRTATDIAAMQLTFHQNAVLDIAIQEDGKTDFTHWMNINYYAGLTEQGIMRWVFTKKDGNEFSDRLLGLPKVPYSPVIYSLSWGDDRRPLDISYTVNDGKLYIGMGPDIYKSAVYIYMNANGTKNTTDTEQKEIRAMYDTMAKARYNYI